jgi:hypothetical protein
MKRKTLAEAQKAVIYRTHRNTGCYDSRGMQVPWPGLTNWYMLPLSSLFGFITLFTKRDAKKCKGNKLTFMCILWQKIPHIGQWGQGYKYVRLYSICRTNAVVPLHELICPCCFVRPHWNISKLHSFPSRLNFLDGFDIARSMLSTWYHDFENGLSQLRKVLVDSKGDCSAKMLPVSWPRTDPSTLALSA